MTAGYIGSLNVVQDSSQATVENFDTNIVFPQKQGGKLKAGVFLSNSGIPNLYKYNALINTKSPSTVLLIPNAVAQSLINTMIVTPITITATNSPLPRTYQNLQLNNTISGFLGSFIFSIALAFKFASIISFIVK